MKNTRTHEELTNAVEINFIELPKVAKGIGKERGPKDLWMQYLAADNEEVLDMLAKESPVLEKAVNKLLYVSADEQLRYELDMREKAELDYWSAMKTNYVKGEEAGRVAGIATGRAEGADEAMRQIVLEMKKKNLSEEIIVEITGLPVERIRAMQ